MLTRNLVASRAGVFLKHDPDVHGGGAGKGEGRGEKGKNACQQSLFGNSLLPSLAFQFGERLRILKQNNVEVLRL